MSAERGDTTRHAGVRLAATRDTYDGDEGPGDAMKVNPNTYVSVSDKKRFDTPDTQDSDEEDSYDESLPSPTWSSPVLPRLPPRRGVKQNEGNDDPELDLSAVRGASLPPRRLPPGTPTEADLNANRVTFPMAATPNHRHKGKSATTFSRDSPLLQKEYPSLRIDQPSDVESEFAPTLVDRDDHYAINFFGHHHYNFFVKYSSHTAVASILYDASPDGSHLMLLTTFKDYEKCSIEVSNDENVSLARKLMRALQEREGEDVLIEYVTNNAAFTREFVKFESKHPQRRSAFKVGIIYVGKNQTHPQEMFKNGQEDGPKCADNFWTFMNLMGQEIDLEQWEAYRGDMGRRGKSYYDRWNDIEVMYHVSPLLNSEMHRRLVGNDVPIIFFMEEGDDHKFDPSELSHLGTVPQLFAVVQPVGENYRIATFSNINIKETFPLLPPQYVLSPEGMKNHVCTKMYNGLVMSQYCPPLQRLFYAPRRSTLKEIVDTFPSEKKDVKNARLKEEWKILAEKRRVNSDVSSKIICQLIGGRDIGKVGEKPVPMEPYCSVSLVDQKEKTRSAHAFNPLWSITFTFSLYGVEKLHDSLVVSIYDQNTKASLGRVSVPVSNIIRICTDPDAKNPNWFPVYQVGHIEASGSLLLGFSLNSDLTS
eukprot:TRINITY_DN5469_c0_g1_i1.p1 TRINITY_DN5469_c0_g1~~TRINITY_DN5469_c0_g1_i1.p1  ORF type:complete len:649 (-),score=99.97 TRINITY_DN5469_c0_g1_i1:337-2283(-)